MAQQNLLGCFQAGTDTWCHTFQRFWALVFTWKRFTGQFQLCSVGSDLFLLKSPFLHLWNLWHPFWTQAYTVISHSALCHSYLWIYHPFSSTVMSSRARIMPNYFWLSRALPIRAVMGRPQNSRMLPQDRFTAEEFPAFAGNRVGGETENLMFNLGFLCSHETA